MAPDIYTLTGLYNKGIIDYVPYELATPIAGGSDYLNTAIQGNLYQNYGTGDSYNFSNTMRNAGYSNVALNNTQIYDNGILSIGTQTQAGRNAFGLQGVGVSRADSFGATGINGIGTQTQAGRNAFGLQGVGIDSNAGLNAFGGDIRPDSVNAIKSAASANSNLLLGIAGLGIILLTIRGCIKGLRKPKPKQSFFQKINPMNLLRKKKK